MIGDTLFEKLPRDCPQSYRYQSHYGRNFSGGARCLSSYINEQPQHLVELFVKYTRQCEYLKKKFISLELQSKLIHAPKT